MNVLENDGNDGEEIVNLLKAIHGGIKKHGLKKIIKSLNCLDIGYSSDMNYEALHFITMTVTSSLKTEPYLLYGFNSRGDVTIARKLCILLFRKHLFLTAAEAAMHFNRTRQIAHLAELELTQVNIKNKQQKDFIELYNKLDEKVADFMVKNLKKQNNGKQQEQ